MASQALVIVQYVSKRLTILKRSEEEEEEEEEEEDF
jgi:hypothetical protein